MLIICIDNVKVDKKEFKFKVSPLLFEDIKKTFIDHFNKQTWITLKADKKILKTIKRKIGDSFEKEIYPKLFKDEPFEISVNHDSREVMFMTLSDEKSSSSKKEWHDILEKINDVVTNRIKMTVYFKNEEELNEAVKRANKKDTLLAISKEEGQFGKYLKYILQVYSRDMKDDGPFIEELFAKNKEEDPTDEYLKDHFHKDEISDFAMFLQKIDFENEVDWNDKYAERMKKIVESANITTFKVMEGTVCSDLLDEDKKEPHERFYLLLSGLKGKVSRFLNETKKDKNLKALYEIFTE